MRLLKALETAARTSACLYGGVVALLLVMRLFIDQRFLPLAVFDILLPAVLMPGLVMLPIFLLLRRKWMVALQIPALVGFVTMYGFIFLPASAPSASEGTTISILTYNMGFGTRRYEDRTRVIIEANADVVALQEVNEAAGEYFDTELAEMYPYRAIHGDNNPPGQAVLSRYPIVEDITWEVERMHQRVVLDINGHLVTFYNVHPVHFEFDEDGILDFEAHYREIDDILERTGQETQPMLIVGDFNTTDQSDIYQRFTELYGDAFREAGSGFGFTFPSRLPLARLDYIFFTAEFTALDAQVWEDTGGSDHHPVFATLEFATGDLQN